MTLLMRDQENWERGKAEGKTEGKFEILDYFLKNNPSVEVDAGASMLGFDTEELTEYKKARGLAPVGV